MLIAAKAHLKLNYNIMGIHSVNDARVHGSNETYLINNVTLQPIRRHTP